MIHLATPNLAGREMEYLRECVETNFVSSVGPFVDRFELEFAKFVGSPNAVAAANGTCAIHIALVLAGVGPGDEVFVSNFTFAASANPIRYQFATPVLVDSEWDTWNLDPTLVVEELARRDRAGIAQPKAIIAVHILGCPARLEAIVEACERYDICLIEDAAEALGATYTDGPYKGRQVGTIGKMGCFSFNGNKIITSGGGGMLVTADTGLAQRAKFLTTQAKRHGYAYFHEEVGYNYRLTNVAAAMGLAQLEQIGHFLERKAQIAAFYNQQLNGNPRVTPPPSPAGVQPTYWLYSVLLEKGWADLLKKMEDNQIQTRPLWTALHLMPPFKDCQVLGTGRVAEKLCESGLSLPCSTNITSDELDQVASALSRFI